jgi:selenocysteine lyase/cysteine desulfurase
VLSRVTYLNAGTDGPLPAAAVKASAAELERELTDGRSMAHFERTAELKDALRANHAALLNADPADVALTTCTTEGIAQTISGLQLGPGDEILTSDEEHPGLLGALSAARERGVSIRMAPLTEIAEAVSPATSLVACSHVGWMSGSFVSPALAQVDVPVLLDGAQGVGAVPVDVKALGCDAYAGSGQKWLCGPDSTGMLYVSGEFRERLSIQRRGYPNLADPGEGLDAQLHADARSLDSLSLSAEVLASALASSEALAAAGWPAIHARASALAAELCDRLKGIGREPAPRGPGTLVAFPSPDPEAERDTLASQDVILRNIPNRPWLRASIGAWNDERDLERLISALSA